MKHLFKKTEYAFAGVVKAVIKQQFQCQSLNERVELASEVILVFKFGMLSCTLIYNLNLTVCA
jgi:hypothetical protein